MFNTLEARGESRCDGHHENADFAATGKTRLRTYCAPQGAGMTQLRDLMRREPRYGLSLPAWLDRLLSAGVVTRDPQVARRQRCVNVAAFVGAISGASYILLTSLYDARGLLLLNVYNALLVVGGIMLPRLHRFGENVAGLALAIL